MKEKALQDIILLTFDGVQSNFIGSVKSLGVILDSTLLLEEQVNAAAKTQFR